MGDPNGNGHDKTPEERAGLIVWHLAHGDALRTQDAASLTGLTRQGAYMLLTRLSRVIPIFQSDDGFWQVVAVQETA